VLHTLAPLAGGSPHNGLQTIHFVQRTLQDALSLHSFFATVFLPTPQALLPIRINCTFIVLTIFVPSTLL
jgi:hypothetical protein